MFCCILFVENGSFKENDFQDIMSKFYIFAARSIHMIHTHFLKLYFQTDILSCLLIKQNATKSSFFLRWSFIFLVNLAKPQANKRCLWMRNQSVLNTLIFSFYFNRLATSIKICFYYKYLYLSRVDREFHNSIKFAFCMNRSAARKRLVYITLATN